MVNTAFALKFTTPCKLASKCGIYHFCFWFTPSLHFFTLYFYLVNLCKSNFSCGDLSFPRLNVSFVRTWKNHSTKRRYYEKGIEEFTCPNYFGYGEFVVEILCYFYTILLRFFFSIYVILSRLLQRCKQSI